MANYTCIMLFISAFENEKDRIGEVNSFIKSDGNKISLIDVNDFNKFPDAFPRFLYVGTYRNFNTKEFLTHLSENVNWGFPQYSQVFIQEEGDYNLKVFANAGRTLIVDSFKETD